MQSKIEVDPLLVALFDIPAVVQVSSKNGRRNATGTPSSGRSVSGRRLNPPDDGVETDTSMLHGESISLTDGEYSDAVAVAHDESPSDNNNRPSSFTTFRPNMVSPPVRLPVSKTPDKYACGGGKGPPLGINTHHHPVRLPVSVSKPSDEYVARGGRTSPPLDISTQRHTMENRSPNKQSSSKKKKKRRSSAIKSLKKLVGRKSKSSSTVLDLSSSFDEADSLISSSTPSSVGDSERSPNTPQNIVDDNLSPERLSTLKSKLGRIRSTIHSLEGDLIATRNGLARAHQHLHLATMELADMQRASLEADIGLSKFTHQHGGVSTSPSTSALRLSPLHFFEAEGSEMGMSTRSRSTSSSDRLHYFTPTSSILESGEDSDYYTPRSTASYDSFLSLNEKDYVSTPFPDEMTAGKSRGDNETTPLTRNGKPKCKRRLKFDTRGKVSNTMDSNKESHSIDTPSTDASTQEEVSMAELNGKTEKETDSEQKRRRLTFFKQQSFIRAHDLALSDDNNSLLPPHESSLLPLHETDVSDVVNALFEKGFESAMDESERWSPESSTGKILSKCANKLMNGEIDGPMGLWPNAAYGDDVLVWTSKCPHDGHGSQYPVVRARGIIPTSACNLVELLLDSGRVKQYNKMSLGRIDEHCFAEGVDRLSECSVTGIRGEAKIVRSKSQPPVIRKPVELRLLLHARRLPSESEEGAKYLTIGRSIWETEHGTAEAEDTSATRCEMLLSVNLIRDLQVRGEQWCEITTITHGISPPGIPIYIGKRVALAAAAKYIRDIRAVFE